MLEPLDELFDVLVIGGGITGCGVARDAALRGLRVALVEREDFGSGTSGRSSRLIHGGIRYLEHGQIHLVHEAIRERQILLRIAPHLVQPLAFTWPIYRGARVGRLKLSAGMLVYDLMAAGRSKRHAMLSAEEVVGREPGLEAKGLTGGALYYDASTDDARLTLANAIAAREAGASVVNHTIVSRVDDAKNGERSVLMTNADGVGFAARARVVVNATGVWQSSFRGGGGAKRAQGSKGIHIAVPRERIGNRAALTLISPIDGRVMFTLPSPSQTIIGTTDTWTDESPEDVRADAKEVDYLIDSVNAYFPAARLTRDDVISAWAGIRPLATRTSVNPTAVSREHIIEKDAAGTIHVTGGKLTTYRSMAAEGVDTVFRALDRRPPRSPTADTPLPGTDRNRDLEQLASANTALGERLVSALPYTAAELVYGVRSEMARTLEDLLIRRTRIAFETRDHGVGVATRAAAIVAESLGWNASRQAEAVRNYSEQVARMFAVRES